MSTVADLIAVSSEKPVYPQTKSKWFGKAADAKKLRLVFSFYSPDGNEVAMPLAAMSAYLKRDFPWVEVILKPILIVRDEVAYNPENYARAQARCDRVLRDEPALVPDGTLFRGP